MQYNYSTAIFLISDDVRCVAVTYEAHDDAARTLFKTFDRDLKVDDYVVVPTDTRHKMTVCKVVEVDLDFDTNWPSDMNWIVGVVNRADFEVIKSQEGDAIARMKAAEKKKQRDELRESLRAHMEEAGDDIKSLPMYSAPKKDEKTES